MKTVRSEGMKEGETGTRDEDEGRGTGGRSAAARPLWLGTAGFSVHVWHELLG